MKNNREHVRERRQAILDLVNANNEIAVEAIAERCGVSAMTVRRDLDALSKSGALVRAHGKAVANTYAGGNLGYDETTRRARAAISAYAAGFLKDGDRLFINGSRTALDMLHYVRDKRLFVQTNNGYAILEQYPDSVGILLIGGVLRHKIMVGEHVMQNLLNMEADKTFIGCAAVYDDGEFSYRIPTEIGINELMISRTRGELYILADHTKLKWREGETNTYGSFRYNHPVTLITDELADPEIVGSLRANGIRVICVPIPA